VDWYFASVVFVNRSSAQLTIRCCHHLVRANTHDEAYSKSIEIGRTSVSNFQRRDDGDWSFQGLEELLILNEVPGDGAEVTWSELELTDKELSARIRKKSDLRAFRRPHNGSSSGWYVADLVLEEIHDSGSHAEGSLVWINSYFIVAQSAENALDRALEIGKREEDTSGSHTCNGDKAHWLFKGLADLIPMDNAPADTALMWCDECVGTESELKMMLPTKAELGVFKWQSEQQSR